MFLTSCVSKNFAFFIDHNSNHIFFRMHFIRYDTFTHWNFFLFHVTSSLQPIFLYLYLQQKRHLFLLILHLSQQLILQLLN
ncbi:hypothetical protein ABH522_002330 [Staphylococcus pasteuri]